MPSKWDNAGFRRFTVWSGSPTKWAAHVIVWASSGGWQGSTLSYDATGNLLGFNSATLTWQNGLLSGYTKTGQATTYSYGPNNIRASKNSAGTITCFTTDANNNVIEQISGTNDLKFYRGVDGTPQYFTLNGTTYYYELNLQGDITGILDGNKQEIATYTYDAWGKLLATGGGAASTTGLLNPLRYKGYYYDNESGLYYLQNRYYSPDLARFISPDAADASNAQGQPLGANLYAYCLNNPITGSDPTGKGLAGDIVRFIYAASHGDWRAVFKMIVSASGFVYLTQHHMHPAIFKLAGFFHTADGVYHTYQTCPQQYGGYNDFYDQVFHVATYMQKQKYPFTYKKNYIFWTWMGYYLNLGAGAELGLYYASPIPGHYLADTKDAMTMYMTLSYKGKKIFNYGPTKAWWMNGFDPYYQNVRPEYLQANYRVYMAGHTDMFKALAKAYPLARSGWTFDKTFYIACLKF